MKIGTQEYPDNTLTIPLYYLPTELTFPFPLIRYDLLRERFNFRELNTNIPNKTLSVFFIFI